VGLLLNSRYSPDGIGTYRWLILLAGIIRVFWDNPGFFANSLRGFVGVITLFIAFQVPIALLSSWLPLLSLLKILSFSIGIFAIFINFKNVSHMRVYWSRWIFSLLIFCVFSSIAVLIIGGGYEKTVRGFQGVTSHPQILGSLLALAGVWIVGQLLTGSQRPIGLRLTALATWYMVLLSASRTSIVATMGGVLVAFVVYSISPGRRQVINVPRLTPVNVLLLVATLIVAIGQSGQVQDAAFAFVQKGNGGATAADLLENSRGELISRSMENFRSAPLWGVGFGTPSDIEQLDRRSETLFGIPIRASAEKGFMPSAVLEETGLFGAVFVIMFIITLVVPIHRSRNFTLVWLVWTALLTNVGEAVLFSLGGFGLFMWVVVGYCYMQAGGFATFHVRNRRITPQTSGRGYGRLERAAQ
jgi:hypothetical protein